MKIFKIYIRLASTVLKKLIEYREKKNHNWYELLGVYSSRMFGICIYRSSDKTKEIISRKSLKNENSKSFDLELFGIRLFSSYLISGLGWFRIFGFGLHWKDTTMHRMNFSERNGYKKALKIGTYRISYLSRREIVPISNQ